MVWVTVFFAIRWLDVSVRLVVCVLVDVAAVAGLVALVSPPWAQKLLIACRVVVMNLDAHRVLQKGGVHASA